MSVLLVFDTATTATVVGVRAGRGPVIEHRDDPAAGDRPHHTQALLALCERALADAGARWADVARIGAGVGPGTFTGLRIGIATARALAQATGAELAGVSTLAALAAGVADSGPQGRDVLAVIDARRGEAYAAGYPAEAAATPSAVAAAPQGLAALAGAGWLAVGDGAVRYRAALEEVGIEVPPGGDPRHHVMAAPLADLAAAATPVPVATLVPHYVRLPDAKIKPRRAAGS